MKITEYIDKFYKGSQKDFAAELEVKPQQVTQWINKDFIVINNTLYSPRRELKNTEGNKMTGYIYNVATNEVVVIINGEDHVAIERKADELNFMGMDEYGLTYTLAEGSNEELIITEYTDTVDA